MILNQIKHAEKKMFPRSEALDFDLELKKRNTELVVVLDMVTPSQAPALVAYAVYGHTSTLSSLHKLVVLERYRCRAPNIGLPINSQVPPVARIDKPFHFTFSDSTFSSTTGNITYAMVDAPAWLQLDASRTLSGSPALHDAGSVNFSLIATDLAGSTTMSVTLVISTDPGPGVGRPVKEQLAAHDGYQGPDTVLLPHSSALSLSFSPDTFVDIDHDTVYYAMSANNTPLPSWITFNPSSLSFSGTAPQNTSPDELPQTFGVQFTASDVPGFSAAVASFQLILENHILIFEQPSYAATMTQGKSFTYTGLRDALMLNGHPIGPVNVKQIHADVPSWASFDQSTWTLSGVPPPSASSQEVSVAATDIYGEVATTTVVLQVSTNGTTDLSDNFVGRVNATPDKDFNYLFNRMLITNPEAELAVDLGAASPWLRYDQADLELSGRVPRDLQPQDVILNVTLTQGSVVQSEPLIIVVQPATHSSNGRSTGTPSPVASSGSAIPSQKPTPSSQSHETAQGLGYSNSRMAAAIAVPVIAVCLLMILACFIIARRRRRQISTDRNADSKRKVSRPFTFYANSDRESTGAVVEKAPPAPKSASSRVPMIDLPDFITSVASKRRSWFRLSKGTTDEPAYNPNTDSWHQYMQGLSTGKQKKAAAPQFSLLPEEQASSVGQGSRISSSKNRSRGLRPSSAVNVCPSKRTGPKKRRSDVTFANPGLRQNRRMSGFGHGRNGASLSNSYLGWSPVGMGHGKGGPPGFGRVRESWRNTSSGSWAPTDSPLGGSDLASSKYNSSERSQNVASIRGSLRRSLTSGTLDYYPQPPVIHEMKTGHRTSIRAIEPDPPQTYGLPLHVFHKRRARNRHYRVSPHPRALTHTIYELYQFYDFQETHESSRTLCDKTNLFTILLCRTKNITPETCIRGQ
ncbi:MAG: hypothetical protein L6R40_007692 [Gallowayella cf. fulva]|nr:MAG: hypothetical protein L6R40_007692 [Xanthomendoza cf. fulva]